MSTQTFSPRLDIEVEGAIGWIVFNSPSRHNAITTEMYAALPGAIERFAHDPAVRVIVMRGEGEKAFVSGADMSKFREQGNDLDAHAAYMRIYSAAQARIEESAKPTIAMIRGYCIGGGLEMALNCDLRISDESGRFAMPMAKLSVGYPWNMMQRFVSIVGPSFAKEMLFTARQFTAAEAHAMGLVNRVVPAAELESFVRGYCATIAENAPLTIEAAKGVNRELTKPGAEIDRARCEALVERCTTSEDYLEGPRAFAEKRKPVFTGR